MKKFSKLASLLALVVTVNMFSASGVFAADPTEEVYSAEETVVEDNALDIESIGLPHEDDTAQFELVQPEDEEMLESAVSEEEDVTGAAPVYYSQPKFGCQDGYDCYIAYVIQDTQHTDILYQVYLVCDIGAYGQYLKYNVHNYYNAIEFFGEDVTCKPDGDKYMYLPKKVADKRDDIPGTALNEFLIPVITQAQEEAMIRDWKDWEDVPVLKDASGHIAYMTTTGIEYPADNGKSIVDADKKDSGSSSGKDDGSSSGKDDGSSSGKDDGSSSGKDDGSSSSKDDGSSSGKDDGSSSSGGSSGGSENLDPTKDPNLGVYKLEAAGRNYEIRWSKTVSYNGKKHIAVGMNAKKKQVADVQVEVWREGVKLDTSKYKLKFKNNLNANFSEKSFAYYTIKLGKGFGKAERKALAWYGFSFRIKPEEAVSANICARRLREKNGKIKVKLQYKFPTGTINLKKYEVEKLEGDMVKIYLYGNVRGKVTVPISQLK